MAPVKRKAVTDDRPNKKAKPEKEKEKHKDSKPRKPSTSDDTDRRPVAKSILQQEEKAFPRGGASVLTPLEQKQIKVQAEQDALFEQQTGQKAPRSNDDDGDLFDDEPTTAPAKKKRKNRKDVDDSKGVPKSGLRIQGLSYKNLVPRSFVLGYVTAITARDLALALPNNLTGYVPLTAISDTLNKRIEKLLDQEDEQMDDSDDIDLNKYFYIGQWLRAVVTASGSDAAETGKSKRHIELSIDPSMVNGGLAADNVVLHSMVQASVRSVEDHGVIMDLGLADEGVKGFVSKKELGAAYSVDDIQEGQVMMCLVTGKGSNGKVLKISPDAARFSALSSDSNSPVVNEAPSVEAFLPGTAVNVLVTETTGGGVAGKIMGMVDVTADLLHADVAGTDVDVTKKYKVGSKIKGRLVFSLPKDDSSRRVGISLLEHALALSPPSLKLPENANPKQKAQATTLEKTLPVSSTVEDAKVVRVLADRGLYLTFPGPSGNEVTAFAHISQVSDNRIDSLSSSSGPYKLESMHKVRIISFNPVDNIYYVSLKRSVLDQSFLRLEDLPVGEVVKGTVERLILGGKTGITGVIVKLSASINGLVPETHLSDVQLQHPERKFREGFPVKARILSVDLDKRQVRLTLKKSLVEDESPIFKSYAELKPGMESKGTIVNLLPKGAAVQFFGNVRAWLPVSEMSETFIERPEKHLKLGQTVNARIVSVNSETEEMKVSCKDAGVFDEEQQDAWQSIDGGEIVSGTVTVKTNDSVSFELESGLSGLVRIGHLVDGSLSRAENALKKVRVGQKLADLVVLDKIERSKTVLLSHKDCLIQAAKDKTLICSFEDVGEGQKTHGFVRNITPEGIYAEFANGTVGLVPKSQIPPEMTSKPEFGLIKDQTLHAWVLSIDQARERFVLSMREQKEAPAASKKPISSEHAVHPVDPTISDVNDVSVGKVTKARIASVKGTQVNVRLADNIQGRIDVSEMFDSWDELGNPKAPLQKFKQNEVLDVKVLGLHDSRNHRFLPISHRGNKNTVYELSAKRSRVDKGSQALLTMSGLKPGQEHLSFVNNHTDECVWVNLSPNVRGRIALMDLSDDVGALQKVERSFPVGSALRVKVKKVDETLGRLDLSAKTHTEDVTLTLDDLSAGMTVPARITKITDRSVNVQLSDNLAGPVPLVELSDDYEEINLAQYDKNDIVRVCVLNVDRPNKKIYLSLRPSKTLSSSLPVKDRHISSIAQLKAGDIVRGFTKHVAEKGVIVSLSAQVDAFVRIGDLTDRYVKDWKSIVEVDTLVTGRILSVDEDTKHIAMSLKASHVDKDYKPPITIHDLEKGMVVTGKVRKVEDFGAFVDIDNTQPRLSGLCHRSEVAAKRIEDVRTLYSAGDVVKAKILSVDVENRKISLGLKASYFADAPDEDEDMESSDGEGVEVADGSEDEDVDMEGGVDLDNVMDMEDAVEEDDDELDDEPAPAKPTTGLQTSGFRWSGEAEATANGNESESDSSATFTSKKRKKSKPAIKVDLTGELDAHGPRSVSDFERLLLSSPHDSSLWIQYMAFHLQLQEIVSAREIAQRALRTIPIRETDEKLNIWIALLNLEVEYGEPDAVEETLSQAIQVQDPLVMHEKLASIYIDSGRLSQAEGVFERMIGNKSFRAVSDVWLNYARFLMDKVHDAGKARALLPKAMQSVVGVHEQRLLSAKFAALEFRCEEGDAERGRTIFEGILSEWPKWTSGWDMWVDLERSRIKAQFVEDKEEPKERVRALMERIVGGKMKKRRAKFLFKRWLEFEEQEGNAKSVEKVKAKAKEYVEALQSAGGADDDTED